MQCDFLIIFLCCGQHILTSFCCVFMRILSVLDRTHHASATKRRFFDYFTDSWVGAILGLLFHATLTDFGTNADPWAGPKRIQKRIQDATSIFLRFWIHFGSLLEDMFMALAHFLTTLSASVASFCQRRALNRPNPCPALSITRLISSGR